MTRLAVLLHRHLDRNAWPGETLSPANRVIVVLIVISCAGAILATEPAFRARWGDGLRAMEWILSVIFALEYLARLVGAGAKLHGRTAFMRRLRHTFSPLAILDLLAIAAFFTFGNDGVAFFLLRGGRLLVFSAFGRMRSAWADLGAAMHARAFELGIAFAIALITLVVAATAMFLVEGEVQPEAFGSIPRALWWSVATLTTVGYGDVYPVTAAGRLVAGLTAIAAIGLAALPAGILAAALGDAARRRRQQRPKSGNRRAD